METLGTTKISNKKSYFQYQSPLSAHSIAHNKNRKRDHLCVLSRLGDGRMLYKLKSHSTLDTNDPATTIYITAPQKLSLRALGLVLDRLEGGVWLAGRGDWWVVDELSGLDWRPLVSISLVSVLSSKEILLTKTYRLTQTLNVNKTPVTKITFHPIFFR